MIKELNINLECTLFNQLSDVEYWMMRHLDVSYDELKDKLREFQNSFWEVPLNIVEFHLHVNDYLNIYENVQRNFIHTLSEHYRPYRAEDFVKVKHDYEFEKGKLSLSIALNFDSIFSRYNIRRQDELNSYSHMKSVL